ncbi:MAG: mono/diheme cytochrome c family protein [Candidatus Aldehydirespiratoraceae bacterium]|jgi:mono/diheme cytochrome c family protein
MTPLQRALPVSQWIVGVAAATAIVLLFTVDGDPPEAAPSLADEIDRMVDTGELIYAARCSSCHGAEGQGGQGPRLAGTVATLYPSTADEIAIVTNGRLGMPPFGGVLTEAEIAEVALFTRLGMG